jgi:ketosteroid isomerase-like protein
MEMVGCTGSRTRGSVGRTQDKEGSVPEQTTTSLEQRVQRLLQLLDSMDLDPLGAMLTDDAQSVDEITRRWTRGRAAIQAYLAQLKDTVSDVHSRMSDAQERIWGDGGLVTFVLDQTYTMDGQQQSISAPTSIVFVRQDGDWKISLIHTVPIPEQQ